MTKLSCNAEACTNNVGGFCTAATIHIHGIDAHSTSGTQCNTFAQKSFRNAVASMLNTNYTGEIRQLFSDDNVAISPNIKCEAINCLYNHSKACTASNVQIYGPQASFDFGTQCETFIEK